MRGQRSHVYGMQGIPPPKDIARFVGQYVHDFEVTEAGPVVFTPVVVFSYPYPAIRVMQSEASLHALNGSSVCDNFGAGLGGRLPWHDRFHA